MNYTYRYWQERLKETYKPGLNLYRFPTLVLWGDDYEDGMRIMWAASADEVLSSPKVDSTYTKIENLQILTEQGWKWVEE